MKSRYPIGTKFYSKSKRSRGYYLRLHDGYDFITDTGERDRTLCATDKEFPEWEGDGTWEKFYDIKYPKEDLFDKLYLTLKK